MSYTAQYPPAHTATYVRATSIYGASNQPWYGTDPALSLVGSYIGTSWISAIQARPQKFCIDYAAAFVPARILLHNYHVTGGYTVYGVRVFRVYGTNSPTAAANTDPANTTDLTLIATLEAVQHISANEPDPQYFALSGSTPYQYLVLIIDTNWGGTEFVAFRHLEFQMEAVPRLASILTQYWSLRPGDSVVAGDLAQGWDIFAGVAAYLDQVYGLRLGMDLVQPWNDAPVVKQALSQPWADAGQLVAPLIQRWQDAAPVQATLQQPWEVMAAVAGELHQQYAILDAVALGVLTQGWDLRDVTPLQATLQQPWSIAADSADLRYTVVITANGQPVRVSHVNIEADLSQDVLTGEIHPETDGEYLLCPIGAALVVTIASAEATETFRLVVTAPRIDEQHGETRYVVEAMSPAALLGEPWAQPVDGEYTGMASVIAAALATPLTVDWQTVDWTIPAATLIASSQTPLAVLKQLAAAVGAVVQSQPDGSIVVAPEYAVSVPGWPSAVPDLAITEILDVFTTGSTPDIRAGHNRFLIGDQMSSADTLRIEEEAVSQTTKLVRGYQTPWTGAFSLRHTGGAWVQIEDLCIETRQETETVEMVAGSGRTRYPIYSRDAVTWGQVNLGSVTFAEDGSLSASVQGESLLTITYTTRCRLWRVRDPQNEQLQLVAEL